jgi:hypothetical protein
LDRIQELRKYVSKDQIGIEIGPWYYPVAPKSEGFNCLVLDIAETETLLARAKVDRLACKDIDKIEEVDLVGSATDIDRLAERRGLSGKVDYILSSHNFELFRTRFNFCRRAKRF